MTSAYMEKMYEAPSVPIGPNSYEIITWDGYDWKNIPIFSTFEVHYVITIYDILLRYAFSIIFHDLHIEKLLFMSFFDE